jgi:phage gp36-like protein
MAYCSESDLQARFGAEEVADLLDRNNDSSPDSDALSSAQGNADATIDGYLNGRYDLPLSPVPTLITDIACNIVRYTLWSNNAPDEVRKRYEDSIARLKDIAKGVISLPSTSTKPETAGGIEYDADAEDNRLFTMSALSDF